jgi:hypothetical protein
MEKFNVLNELKDEFKQRVKILYVFVNYRKGIMIIFSAKNALFFVSIAPETISELRMYFSVAFNSLTFVKN